MLSWFFSLCNPLQTYVRDIYPFRRSVSPQLNLVHMHPERGQELIQKQVLNHTSLFWVMLGGGGCTHIPSLEILQLHHDPVF